RGQVPGQRLPGVSVVGSECHRLAQGGDRGLTLAGVREGEPVLVVRRGRARLARGERREDREGGRRVAAGTARGAEQERRDRGSGTAPGNLRRLLGGEGRLLGEESRRESQRNVDRTDRFRTTRQLVSPA